MVNSNNKKKPIGWKHAGRTIRHLSYKGDLWTILDQWAVANNCILVESDQNSRTYLLGKTPLNRRMLKISLGNKGYVLEAWIKSSLDRGIGSGDMYRPSEYRIDGGGISRMTIRKWAREEINPILVSIGEPPID